MVPLDGYSLRRFQAKDSATLVEVTRAAIQQIGPHGYNPRQVAAWAARHQTEERFLARANDENTWVCVAATKADMAVAYALLERDENGDGHLDMLYCHPDHTRQGLANALLEAADQQAERWSMARLYTEASELARASFERAGYGVIHRRDFEIEGTPIHNYAMEKRL